MDARRRLFHPRQLRWVSAALCLLLLAAVRAQPVRFPEPGVLLVAGERMADPRFSQSVVLIIEHDRTGSWGLVLNKPTDIGVADMRPDLEPSGNVARIYYGGPLQLDRLLFLYRDETEGGAGDGGTGVPDVRWSDSEGLLEKEIAAHPDRVRIYAGYAGWAPGQLEFELAHGGWQMIQGRPENVFSDKPERLWQHLTDVLSGVAI